MRKAKVERDLDVDENTPVEEALKRLELMKNDKLTNATILLFGKNPQRFFLQAETRCARRIGLNKRCGKKEGEILCVGLDLSDIYRTFIGHLSL